MRRRSDSFRAVPLKRDPSLVPLSHDHHHGLVRVFEIRQALRAATGLEAQAALARRFWEESLVPHFAAEEEALFPAMHGVDGAAALIERLCDEHRRLEAMAFAADPAPESLRTFADLLEGHIRLEERQLFPSYQAHVPQARRDAVEQRVRAILKRASDSPASCDLPRRG